MTAGDYLPVNPVLTQPSALQSSQAPVQSKLRNVLILTHGISNSLIVINNFGSKYPICSLEVIPSSPRLLLSLCVKLHFCPIQFSAFSQHPLPERGIIHTTDTGYLQSQILI